MNRMRLVVVSNRLPIVLEREGNGWRVESGTGGLVTALAPVLKDRGGLWIGWPGSTDAPGLADALAQASGDMGYRLIPIPMDEDDIRLYYQGFANQIVWPLFHDLQTRCDFDPSYWYRYVDVNRRIASVVARESNPADYIWINDYQLMNVGGELRRLGVDRRTGFFLHIPFPSVDIFEKLPWRFSILQALLSHELVGFQTMRDRRNFVECILRLRPDVRVQGRGTVVNAVVEGRQVRLGAFPISIDARGWAKRAEQPAVREEAAAIRDRFRGEQIILGLDRLDYTKGIIERLKAFRTALERFPELRGRVVLVQVVVPSRKEVGEYQNLRFSIARLISEINGNYGSLGWVPVHYHFRSLSPDELLALYRAADIALITPLKDGMNLVAKEYCVCNLDDRGALILSEFAGAAAELQRGALVVNPNDREAMAEAIRTAFLLPPEERRGRMRRMREVIRRHDIFWWVESFLQAAFARHLGDFPPVQEFIPTSPPDSELARRRKPLLPEPSPADAPDFPLAAGGDGRLAQDLRQIEAQLSEGKPLEGVGEESTEDVQEGDAG